MSSILVTGGLGYIGSHVTLLLLEQGYQVTVLDNLSNSKIDTLDTIQQLAELTVKPIKLQLFQLDICDKPGLDQFFKQCASKSDTRTPFQAIIHLAGLKSVPESIQRPDLYYQNNVIGSRNLIELSLRYSVSTFIFSSSATVYGGAIPDKGYSEELAMPPERAEHMYGRSKRQVELMMEQASIKNFNTQFISLRYFNPVGNHSSGLLGENIRLAKATNLLAMLAKVYCSNDPDNCLYIFGNDYSETPDGTCQRDFIHVMDLAQGHVATLNRPIIPGVPLQTYNLGCGQPTSVMEIITEFHQVSGKSLPTKIVARREGDLPVSFANVKRANQQLGWKTHRTLTDACQDLLTRCNYFIKDGRK